MMPDFQTLMRPVLVKLADGHSRPTKELIVELADDFTLSDIERTELISSGSRRWNGKVHWAITYLAQAGLVERPQRAQARITSRGTTALSEHPVRIDMKTLRCTPSIVLSETALAKSGPSTLWILTLPTPNSRPSSV